MRLPDVTGSLFPYAGHLFEENVHGFIGCCKMPVSYAKAILRIIREAENLPREPSPWFALGFVTVQH